MKFSFALLFLSYISTGFSQNIVPCYSDVDSLYGFCIGDSLIVDYQYTDYNFFALVQDRFLVFKDDKIGITDSTGKLLVPMNTLNGDYMSVFNWDGELYASETDVFQMVNDEGLMALYNIIGDCLFDFKYW